MPDRGQKKKGLSNLRRSRLRAMVNEIGGTNYEVIMAELKKLLGSYLSNICALERCMFETVQLQIQDPQVPAHRKTGLLLSKLVSAHKTHVEKLEEKIALSDG